MYGHPLVLLLIFVTIHSSSQSSCFQGSLLSSVKDDFKPEGRSVAKKNDVLCRVIMNYEVNVDTCELKSLDGWAGEETVESSLANKCVFKTNLFPKSIVCYCSEDNCNKLDKTGLQDQITAFKAQLNEKPKSNAVVLHEIDCLLKFLKPEEEIKPQMEANAEKETEKSIFDDPLHCTLFIAGVILAVLAITGICFLIARKNRRIATEKVENKNNNHTITEREKTEIESRKEVKKSAEVSKERV